MLSQSNCNVIISFFPDEPLDEDYDSDSSLTAAANKSLDMSRSLGDQCGDLTRPDLSEDEDGVTSDTEAAAVSVASFLTHWTLGDAAAILKLAIFNLSEWHMCFTQFVMHQASLTVTVKWVIIGSCNGLLLMLCQAITCTSDRLFSIGTLGNYKQCAVVFI